MSFYVIENGKNMGEVRAGVNANFTKLSGVLSETEVRALGYKIGDIRFFKQTGIRKGWLPCNGLTIGNSMSGADYCHDSLVSLFDVIKTFEGNDASANFLTADKPNLPSMGDGYYIYAGFDTTTIGS